MIVTDLDRTLLHSDKTVSDYTARILLACQQQGIMVVFATARSENACKRFTSMIKPDAMISNGGAFVCVGNEIVYRATMDMEITNKLLLSCLKQPSVGYIAVDAENGYFVNKPVDESSPTWADYLPAQVVDLSHGLSCAVYKISAEISAAKAAYEIAAEFPALDMVTWTGENWVCFSDKTASKWRGLKALAGHTGIDTAHIATFGDDYIDIEMLRESGVGVAVANAIDEVKVVADYTCDTNDNDGVARWLEENVL